MKSKLLALMFLAGGALFAGPRFVVGVGLGYGPGYYAPPPPPPPVVSYYARPAYPGPGYAWVDGYWNWAGARYAWTPGYWGYRPYPRSTWVGPRYYGHQYYRGYWRR
jgi:hypothetical protein